MQRTGEMDHYRRFQRRRIVFPSSPPAPRTPPAVSPFAQQAANLATSLVADHGIAWVKSPGRDTLRPRDERRPVRPVVLAEVGVAGDAPPEWRSLHARSLAARIVRQGISLRRTALTPASLLWFQESTTEEA